MSLYEDYKIIAPGVGRVVIIRYWIYAKSWNVFYEDEANTLSLGNNSGKTPEEALNNFIKYRINGENTAVFYDSGNWAEEALSTTETLYA